MNNTPTLIEWIYCFPGLLFQNPPQIGSGDTGGVGRYGLGSGTRVGTDEAVGMEVGVEVEVGVGVGVDVGVDVIVGVGANVGE